MTLTFTLAQLLWAVLAVVEVVGTLWTARLVTRFGWSGYRRIVGAILWPLTLLLFWIVSMVGIVQ